MAPYSAFNLYKIELPTDILPPSLPLPNYVEVPFGVVACLVLGVSYAFESETFALFEDSFWFRFVLGAKLKNALVFML